MFYEAKGCNINNGNVKVRIRMNKIINLAEKIINQNLSLEKVELIKYNYQKVNNLYDKLYVHSPSAIKLKKDFKDKLKIGMAILVHERPEFLELCLNSLFQTNLYDYDITILLQDDGSVNPTVRKIIEKERDPQYNIIRSYYFLKDSTPGEQLSIKRCESSWR